MAIGSRSEREEVKEKKRYSEIDQVCQRMVTHLPNPQTNSVCAMSVLGRTSSQELELNVGRRSLGGSRSWVGKQQDGCFLELTMSRGF